MAAYREKLEVDKKEEKVSAELRELRREFDSLDQEVLEATNDMNQVKLQDEHNRSTLAAVFVSNPFFSWSCWVSHQTQPGSSATSKLMTPRRHITADSYPVWSSLTL